MYYEKFLVYDHMRLPSRKTIADMWVLRSVYVVNLSFNYVNSYTNKHKPYNK